MVVAEWLWASPPDEVLRGVARDLEGGGLPLEHRPLKDGKTRQVWSAPSTAGGLLIKRFVVHGWEARRSPVWPSRARREYRIMEELCRLGVPTVRPLACGERRESSQVVEAWFLGRLLPEARTLLECLEEASARADTAARDALLDAALDTVAAMHRHPFLHRDLHAGNLLVDGDGRARVIDLHSVWRLPRMTLARRAEMLGRLLFSLRGVVHLERDVPALVTGYAARMNEPVDVALPAIRAATDAFERDYVRGRTARCLRRSTEFTHGRGAGGSVHRRREYALEALERDLVAFEAVVQQAGDDLLGDARRSQVVRVGERVLKTFRERGLVPALRGAAGEGRARSAWWAARRLSVAEIPTPEALALLERRDGSAVLVTRFEQGAILRDRLAEPLSPLDRRGLARAAGWLFGRLAREGLRHNDLAPKNLFVAPGELPVPRDLRHTPRPGTPRVMLIDLDNLSTMKPFDRPALARMLGQLADLPIELSRTDRARFAAAFERAAGRALPPDVVIEAQAFTTRRRARRESLARRP